MAQTSLYPPPHEKLASPVAKRSRLSLKQNRQLFPEPAMCFESRQQETIKDLTEKGDSIQDENASPNCSSSPSPSVATVRLERTSIPGLPNCGNTCYVNSILQVLRYTPNFLNCVHWLQAQVRSCTDEAVKEAQFFVKLHVLYSAMRKQQILSKNIDKDFSGYLLRPVKSFLTSLREMSSTFEEGEQHDAHELLLTILSSFNSLLDHVKGKILLARSSQSVCEDSELLKGSKPERNVKARLKRQSKLQSAERSLFDSRTAETLSLGFEGQMRHSIKCLECEKRLDRSEIFTNLEVPIADHLVFDDTVDLVQCLIQQTVLYGENKYFCDDCYHLNEAQMRSEVVLLPPILLLHCSWLKQSSDLTENEKDCTKVLIPLVLRTSENTEIFCCAEDEKYVLYALVLHLGTSTEGGHYVTFVKDAGKTNTVDTPCCTPPPDLLYLGTDKWLLFDDENVTVMRVSEMSEVFPYFDFLGITATPMMIFYCKL